MSRIQKDSLKFKIIKITILFTFTLTIFISFICFFSFQTLLANSLTQATKFNLQLIMDTFTTNIAPVISLSNWASSNSLIAKYVVAEQEEKELVASASWERLREECRNNQSYSYLERVVISDFHYNYIQIMNGTNYYNGTIAKAIHSLPYFQTLYEDSTIEWIGFMKNPFSIVENERIIPIIRPIYHTYGRDKVGFVYIAVCTNLLTNCLKDYTLPTDSKLFITFQQNTYEIQHNTFYEVQTDYTILDQKKEIDSNTVISTVKDIEGKKQTMLTVGTSLNGCYLTQSLSKQQFSQQKMIYIILIIFICFVILLSGIYLMVSLNKLINIPLGKINEIIYCIAQGNFMQHPEIEWKNEFGTIGKGINKLSKDIVQLMDIRIASEKEKQELEYQMLQSQINPHFLYNTLNSIKWMATIQNANGIAEMTTALSRLMRSISKDTNQVVCIRDEINLLDNYFIIQQYRYGGTITLDYKIEEESLYNCKILKFTLQPMVENAIFHGIEPKGMAGTILIEIKHLETDKILIQITDNGIGMTQEQIKQILTDTPHTSSNFFKQIGIGNVQKRIHYTFGTEYGLSFSSELGKYTTISIVLPYEIEESK